jgi:S-adenosylmethionine:tRNA ribosyltransferase-isomerase
LKIGDFDYRLPPEAVAQEPLPERDASRLLVLERRTGALRHAAVRALPDLLAPGDLLVFNRSRVFPARLLGRREGGGAAELLLVAPRPDGSWEALARPSRQLRPGTRVRVAEDLDVLVEGDLRAPGRKQVRLEAPEADVWAALERHGHAPLPPYIRRPDRPEDRERYQTVFARERGSVAAPTAGLHFTPALLAALAARGIERAEVVLHVGPGTFRPVQVEEVAEHRIEAEPFLVPEEAAAAVGRARARRGRVVAVGTTTTRVLESRAAEGGEVRPGSGSTDLVILPGHRFQVVDALFTNFHLPRSSLLLLVAAFAGRERVLAAYGEAIRARYRFYSYGDAMLIL